MSRAALCRNDARSIMHRNAASEAQRIIGHRHRESQQLLLRFFGGPKRLYQDAAGRQIDAGRKGIEFLVDDGGRGFHQHAGLLSFGTRLGENVAQALAAFLFEIGGLARGQMPQVRDDILFCGEAAFAHGAPHQRLEDLLGATPADTEHELERGTIDERIGQVFELFDDLIEAVIPERFVRQATPCNFTKG